MIWWPVSPLDLSYVRLILIAAPLILVPLCEKMDGRSFWWPFGLGCTFSLGILLPAGWLGAFLVSPWLLFSVVRSWETRPRGKQAIWLLPNWLQFAPFLFLFIAACWALADRLTLEPMGFDATIVLLTAVHFHYAGFALTWLVAHWNKGPVWMQLGILLGVVLVAVGITSSQYQLPIWIEVVSVSLLALSASRLAWEWLRTPKLVFIFSGLALAGGMLLALAYGWRYYLPIQGLNIPIMYALHGSLNSLGFSLPGVLGFYYIQYIGKQRR